MATRTRSGGNRSVGATTRSAATATSRASRTSWAWVPKSTPRAYAAHTSLRQDDHYRTCESTTANEDETLHVVQNGEIYNYRELRRELERAGHRFRTSGDTEVLLHLYEEHGDGFAERLRGMFAIAIWDAPRRRLVLARDRFGIKPLYYRATDSELAFASELRA